MIISVCLQKGGSGKTTTALSIGQGLRAMGYRVLYVDMDGQCSLTDMLGGYDGQTNVVSVMNGRLAITTGRHGDYIAGSDRIEQAVANRTNVQVLARYLQSLDYDYILIDTPPALSQAQRTALMLSEGVIIPLQADRASYAQLEPFMQYLDDVRRHNPALGVVGYLVTHWNPRIRVNAAYRDAISDLMGGIPCLGFVRECSAIRECQAVDGDLFKDYPTSNAVSDYRTIIEQLIKRNGD